MPEAERIFARRVIIVLILCGAAAVAYYTARLLIVMLAGVIGAILLNTATEWIKAKLKLRYRTSYFVIFFGLVGVVALVSWALAPRVIVQVSQIGASLPNAARNSQNWLNQTAAGKVIASHSGAIATALAAKAGSYGFQAIDLAIFIFIAIVLSLYLAATPVEYERGVLDLLPPRSRGPAIELFRDVSRTVGWWMLGQLIPMTVLGSLSMLALWIIGVPLAFTLGLFTGLMIFIPYAGAIIAFIVTALVTLSSHPGLLPLVIGVYIGIHILEGYILTPLVQQRAVHLPPALTIFSQIVLTALFGFMGLIVATPFAAACMVLVRRIYLEEDTEVPPLVDSRQARGKF